MKIKVEIDDEIADQMFRDNLKWHIEHISEDLKKLNKTKKLENYQREDKAYFTKLLPALKVVGEYYGVK